MADTVLQDPFATNMCIDTVPLKHPQAAALQKKKKTITSFQPDGADELQPIGRLDADVSVQKKVIT